MLKGIDIDQRIPFSSKEDKSEPKTVFVLKPMTGLDMLGFSEFVTGGKLSLTNDSILDYLYKSVHEIKNFNDEGTVVNGAQVKDILRMLPINILTELVTETGKINNLTKEEEKNS